MATIRRPAPASASAWDVLKHAADSVCSSAGAYLAGRFAFTFANRTAKTVKMHLAEDLSSSEAADPDGAQRSDYFLTVPPGSMGVEVPMPSSRVRVTAGFFHADSGHYEIFWESRSFAWEPGLVINVEQRHSVDVNRFRVDVWPGAPLAVPVDASRAELAVQQPCPSRGLPFSQAPAVEDSGLRQAGQASLRLLMLPGAPPVLGEDLPALPGLQIFSCGRDGWVAGSLARELADGSLELRDGPSSIYSIKPQDQPSLVRIPALMNSAWSTLASSQNSSSPRTVPPTA